MVLGLLIVDTTISSGSWTTDLKSTIEGWEKGYALVK
jgi:hypothetical protein